MPSTLLFLTLTLSCCLSKTINVLVINDRRNEVGKKVFHSTLAYLEQNTHLGVQVAYASVEDEGEGGQPFLDRICSVYQESLSSGRPPHLVLDLTVSGAVSEAAKAFSFALALPTLTTTAGRPRDIWTWRELDTEQHKYLVQVSPPADIVPEIINSLAIYQNLTNAAVLFDDSFEMNQKYKSLLRNLPVRHILLKVNDSHAITKQLIKIRNLDVVNFVILGKLSTIKNILDSANVIKYLNKQFAWYAITQDSGELDCSCSDATLLFIQPELERNTERQVDSLRTQFSLNSHSSDLEIAFYFDIFIQSFMAVQSMHFGNGTANNINYITCDEYNNINPPVRINMDLIKYLKQVDVPFIMGPLHIDMNRNSQKEFVLKLEKMRIVNSRIVAVERVATWPAGLNRPITVHNILALKELSPVPLFRVVTALQKPFVMIDKNKTGNEAFSGYSIDLLKDIAKLVRFEYEIYVSPNNDFGQMDEKGQWNGMIGELLNKNADLAISSLYVTTERQSVIDFTVPYYDLIGISMLMKKTSPPSSLFSFLTVLETEVWLCISGAYLFTSLLMWGFERFSPYSYKNNTMAYNKQYEQREFTLRECLWFCITSLTPQGGGEAPKNISGRLLAATWWLFGFIIIASYTANLAAFLTISRLDTPVQILDDLHKQYKIQYAPLNDSWVKTYFKRMARIEKTFYEIWKKMSLNTSMSLVERAKLAVWDYPISKKYKMMWRDMNNAGFPESMEEAVNRVLQSKSSTEGFAFIGDAIDVKYQALTNCELQEVGEQFSRKPFAIGIIQEFPLKDSLNFAILQLLNKRRLETLKENWWDKNPERKECVKPYDQSDGINIQNIGGVFIVIFVGMVFACLTLIFEYWLKKNNHSKGKSLKNGKPFGTRRNLMEMNNSSRDDGIILRRRNPNKY